MVTDLKPATASGQPPSVVIAHADADTARILRAEPVRELLAQIYTEVTATACGSRCRSLSPTTATGRFPPWCSMSPRGSRTLVLAVEGSARCGPTSHA